MTINKLAYVSSTSPEEIERAVEDRIGDNLSIHTDNTDETELWVEIGDGVLEILLDEGFISESEKAEIIENGADTILFF